MKNKKDIGHKAICNSSSLFIVAVVSFIGGLIFTEDITFIARVTLRWPDYIQVVGGGELHEKPQPRFDIQQSKNPTSENADSIDRSNSRSTTPSEAIMKNVIREEEEDGTRELATKGKRCNLSKGKWVFDNVTRPLYREEECEFLTSQVTCVRNGRKDTSYQNWRWQPTHCSLPKFEARLLLEKLRGKRVVFVGDSVNRNQWESMICLLHTVIAPGRSSLKIGAPLSVYSIQDYNATVEFYWSPYLVESNSDDPRNHSISQRIIIQDSISKHGVHWKNADLLIFNTYIWWMNSVNIKVLRGSSFNETPTRYVEIERSIAYKRVLKTWAHWLKRNVDLRRVPAFFISMSPVHELSAYWNNPNGIACALEKTPIPDTFKPLDIGTDLRLLEVAKTVIRSTRTKVTLIDITALSQYRKDGHTSVYTIRQGKVLTPEQKGNPAKFADCLHWCLPGVPDTWNELLYAHIISRFS